MVMKIIQIKQMNVDPFNYLRNKPKKWPFNKFLFLNQYRIKILSNFTIQC